MRSWDVFSGAVGLGVLATSVVASGPSKQESPPTWAKDIAPMVYSSCVTCHSEGGHSPFPLTTYDEVRRRSELVRQVVLNRLMPPCAFSSDFATFCRVKPVTDEQSVMLQKWIRAGMPEGSGAPTAPVVEHGFRSGKPDMVLIPSVLPKVPSEGNPVWRALMIDPGHKQELRITGFDVKPRDPQCVRHVLLAVASERAWMNTWPTNGTLDDNAVRLIGAWAPGYGPFSLPDRTSIVLQPGEKLIAQVLYQTIGRPVDPSVEIGLYLSRSEGDRIAQWTTKEQKEFVVPTFDEVTITTTTDIDRDVDLIAIHPEARFFAYVVEITAKLPGGDTKKLLQTNRWNPYWNGSFVFSPPVKLPKGTRIESSTVYENELHSPINEGMRPRTVYAGPGLDQEVCRTHYLLADR